MTKKILTLINILTLTGLISCSDVTDQGAEHETNTSVNTLKPMTTDDLEELSTNLNHQETALINVPVQTLELEGSSKKEQKSAVSIVLIPANSEGKTAIATPAQKTSSSLGNSAQTKNHFDKKPEPTFIIDTDTTIPKIDEITTDPIEGVPVTTTENSQNIVAPIIDKTSETDGIYENTAPLSTTDPTISNLNRTNLLNNSGFETGDKSGWRSAEGIVSANNVSSGRQALEVYGNPDGYTTTSQSISIIAGHVYQFSGNIAVDNLTTGSYRFQIRWYNSAGEQLGSLRKTFGNTNTSLQYKWHGVEFVANEFAATATFLLIAANADGTGYFDDLEIIDLTESTPSMLPIEENFETELASNWVVIDDSPALSDWQILDGVYLQGSERDVLRDRTNRRAALDGTYHLGTYAYLENSQSLINYRVTLDMTPIEELGNSLTDDGYDIGIMFRYQDNSNYYRILNTAYGYARFERKLDGVFSTLSVDARGYISEGHVIQLDVQVINDLIQIYINGEPRFSAQDSTLASGGIALYTQDSAQFDNILITEPNTTPTIVIDKPMAYSAQTKSSMEVSAIVLNPPAFAQVNFDIDGVLCDTAIERSPGYFSAICTEQLQGEHTITATLSLDNAPLSIDQNRSVGSSGDIRIAIGDSLTNGYGDTFSADNHSSDGKVIAEQGYIGILQSLLSTSSATPTVIYNEGIPGDTSKDIIKLRLSSILERHPDANIAQIMVGTNDSGKKIPVPSGIACQGYACKGTYKENLQKLINTLKRSGVRPVLSILPPVFNSDATLTLARNEIIKEYNAVIQTELTGHDIGPNLFEYFLNENEQRRSLYTDSSHFNGLGYSIVGYLWEHHINGSETLPSRDQLPLVLEDICVRQATSNCQIPLTYKQDYMQIGNPYFVDEEYEILSIPEELENGVWIMTANADRDNSRSDFLFFSVDRDVEVYVAYDDTATDLPSWLDDFSITETEIITTNDVAPELSLFKKTFSYGIDTTENGYIVLGGNLAVDMPSAVTNYTVIVKAL